MKTELTSAAILGSMLTVYWILYTISRYQPVLVFMVIIGLMFTSFLIAAVAEFFGHPGLITDVKP